MAVNCSFGSYPGGLTISHVAKMLGEDKEFLWEIAGSMMPEHGCLWVVGIGEDIPR